MQQRIQVHRSFTQRLWLPANVMARLRHSRATLSCAAHWLSRCRSDTPQLRVAVLRLEQREPVRTWPGWWSLPLTLFHARISALATIIRKAHSFEACLFYSHSLFC